ncbi:MAG: DNA-protecting protein DprA [Peptostreptococcaceae bacterium]|nr:DNA-protecting protein DprA [Peptostreptococcaceae bacterium]
MKIEKIDKNSDLYPYKLRNIKNSPAVIYTLGDISLLSSKSIAVVGARECTNYGAHIAKLIGERLAELNITVVSGMAKGIDSYSHKGALYNCGKTIAVLGCGLGHCYPAENKELMKQISKEGLLISEYKPEFTGAKYSFPQRNRIISGISESVVVVEAEYKSGSLITAGYGAEQGKYVYAVPGNIDRKSSLGTNMLIRDGATPLVVIDDLARDIGITPKIKPELISNLGKDEMLIIEAIMSKNEADIDYISHKTNIHTGKANGILTILMIKGLVFSIGSKFFIANY